ncbi:hypothetical protein CLCAR_3224 [Clostridium carboxidivorans P7]|nr:hypothetical protein CLCAR_3224 [Clostridium carboxidivorans P7]
MCIFQTKKVHLLKSKCKVSFIKGLNIFKLTLYNKRGSFRSL